MRRARRPEKTPRLIRINAVQRSLYWNWWALPSGVAAKYRAFVAASSGARSRAWPTQQATGPMSRMLSLLLVCVAFIPGLGSGSAAAHDGHPHPVSVNISKADPARSPVMSTALPRESDCPADQTCCKFTCAPCKLPLPAEASEISRPTASSAVAAFVSDLWRSITLSRDPPVPRSPA